MPSVPQSILDVERPANTAVIDSGANSMNRYIVRRRATAEELAINPQSKYKETVGHIVDHVFVPKTPKADVSSKEPYMVSFGASALVLSFALGFYALLKKAFPVEMARRIITTACLKVVYPAVTERTMGIRSRRLSLCRLSWSTCLKKCSK